MSPSRGAAGLDSSGIAGFGPFIELFRMRPRGRYAGRRSVEEQRAERCVRSPHLIDPQPYGAFERQDDVPSFAIVPDDLNGHQQPFVVQIEYFYRRPATRLFPIDEIERQPVRSVVLVADIDGHGLVARSRIERDDRARVPRSTSVFRYRGPAVVRSRRDMQPARFGEADRVGEFGQSDSVGAVRLVVAEDVTLASVLARPVAPCRRVLHGGLRACISERFFRGAAQLAGIRGADLVFAGPYPVIVYEQRVLGALVGRLLGGPFAQQHRADRSTRLRNPDRSPCPVRDYEASPARFQIEGVAEVRVFPPSAERDEPAFCWESLC